MRNLLPTRCPAPNICETSLHWTKISRLHCEYLQTQESAEVDEVPLSYEERRQIEKNAAATTAHVPVPTAHSADLEVLRNGERQLITLDHKDVRVLGCLASVDIYIPNERLRSGRSLAVDAGAYIGYEGRYNTQQAFIDDALDVFRHLGSSINLDAPVRLFRGVGLPENPNHEYPDIAELSRHLRNGTPRLSTFTDDGFGFATTDPETALCYDGRRHDADPPRFPVLFELTAHAGLCVPEQMQRSQVLFGHTFDSAMLATDMSQVIFPPGTRWEILRVEKDSSYGVPLVRMRQI